MHSPRARTTMTRVIPKENAMIKGLMMEKNMTETVMGRREMTAMSMLDGRRPWQRSWERRPLRARAASWQGARSWTR